MITLRDYQIEAILALRTLLNQKHSVLYVLPTGAGKTIIMVDLVRRLEEKGKRAVILCHRMAIQEQTTKLLDEWGCKNSRCHLVQGSRSIKKIVDADLLVFDEAHHCPAPTWLRNILRSKAKILGFTATPYRKDGQGLGDIFEYALEGPSYQSLVYAGFLAPCKVFTCNAPADDPVSCYQRLAPNKKMLLFARTIKEAQKWVDKFNKINIPSFLLKGKTPLSKRDEVVELFKRGDIKILASCDVISEGFDVPICDGVIILRNIRSKALYVQQIGRALRSYPGKEGSIILDHAGISNLHGSPEEWLDWSLADGMYHFEEGNGPSQYDKELSNGKIRKQGSPTREFELDILKKLREVPEFGLAITADLQKIEEYAENPSDNCLFDEMVIKLASNPLNRNGIDHVLTSLIEQGRLPLFNKLIVREQKNDTRAR